MPDADRRPSVGEVVLFTLTGPPAEGELRPALVVNAKPAGGGVALVVFVDGDRDDPIRPAPGNLLRWIPNAHQGTAPGEYRWRTPRHADAD